MLNLKFKTKSYKYGVGLLVSVCLILISSVYFNAQRLIDASASTSSRPQWVFTDSELDDTDYQYKLAYVDEKDATHYLYFDSNGSKWKSDMVEDFHYGSFATCIYVGDGRVSFSCGMCHIHFEEHLIITNDFYLEKLR